jgi:hypothetical protein
MNFARKFFVYLQKEPALLEKDTLGILVFQLLKLSFTGLANESIER